jgi:RND family efflux transporter MFP subunit
MKTGYILLIVSGIFLAACGSSDETRDRDTQPVAVKTVTVTASKVKEKVTFSGKVYARTAVNISTKLMGRIENLTLDEGDEVSKGQILVTISNRDIRAKKQSTEAALNAAQANLEKVKKDFNRIANLHQKKSATDKELDEITYAHEAAKAQVASLQNNLIELDELLSYSVIRAPFDGFITQKLMDASDLANPGMPILRIESRQQPKVLVKIPEQDLQHLSLGDPAVITIDALNSQFKGEITHINPSSIQGNLQFEATIMMDLPPNSGVRAGMFAEVAIEQPGLAKILISRDHLISRGQLKGVYTINGQDKLSTRWLRLGKTYGNKIEVLSGLTEGESYVVPGDNKLSGGLLVVNSK